MSLGGGDQMARGATKHQFPSLSSISQQKWDAIFKQDDKIEKELAAKHSSVPKSAKRKNKSRSK